MRNNSRYDLSDRLIHFFRDVDTSKDDAPATPQHWGYGSRTDSERLSAHFLQRHAIRQGRLWATWSHRSGERTIYGPNPTVCFTEMPIAAFVEASLNRYASGQAISPFALVLPKKAVFAAGARPAIYGLAVQAATPHTPDFGERTFPASVLPAHEQFRYVSFDAYVGIPDWSHEREWRWPLKKKPRRNSGREQTCRSDDLAGFNLDDPEMAGLGVIVGTDLEADRVVHDILTKVDRGDVDQAHYQFVLAHKTIADWAELRDPRKMRRRIENKAIDLAPFFGVRKKLARARIAKLSAMFDSAAAKLRRRDRSASLPDGKCWLWIGDNRHKLVRALVARNRVTVTKDGAYLVALPRRLRDRPMGEQVAIVERVAKKLRTRYGLEATCHRVAGSKNPEGDLDRGDMPEDDFFYNDSGWVDPERTSRQRPNRRTIK